MTYTGIRYGILLSTGQLDFLRDDQQGFHRAEALATFVGMAAIEPSHYEKKNFKAELDAGQFVASTVELATLWGCDRKTAAKIVRMFNEMGILTSEANNRTTVHTIHCLAFWLGKDGDEEKTIKNPHYTRCPDIKSVNKAEASGVPAGENDGLKEDGVIERNVDNAITNNVSDRGGQTVSSVATELGVQGYDKSTESQLLHATRKASGNQVTPTTGFPTSDHGADTINAMRHGQQTSFQTLPMFSDSDEHCNAMGNNRPTLGNDHTLSNASSTYPDSPINWQQATAGETTIPNKHGI